MARRNPEEKNVLALIEAAPFTTEEKAAWTNQVQSDGVTEELLVEIQQKLKAIPMEKFAGDWQHARVNMELTGILKRFQLEEASKNFKHNR
jgi:hypothetical protein